MSQMSIVEAVRAAMVQEMRRDSRVCLLGEDVGVKGGVFKATDGLQAEFGDPRVMDAPIGESGIAGMAIGAAMLGFRPIAEFQFADYSHPAFDQIVSQAATIRWRSVGGFDVPVVFRAPCGAGVLGGLYHSQSVEAFYCHVPGLKVVFPSTPSDAKGLLVSAIRDPDPVWFFEHKKSYRRYREEVPDDPDFSIPIGEARVDRAGTRLSVITYGVGVHWAREAVEMVPDISVEILDLRTLAPLDHEAIARSVRKTSKVLIVHEDNRTMGLGAEIAAFIAEDLFEHLDGPIMRVAANDCHLPYNLPEESAIIPNPTVVAEAIRKLAAY
ncbi:MAG: alpha-ketoacid dehydrogenase subunit beta [Chloroflexi bacterium]|nr:alpha-ketoacid dehydrogenase subunit beta [Chloroflexota bacterium]